MSWHLTIILCTWCLTIGTYGYQAVEFLQGITPPALPAFFPGDFAGTQFLPNMLQQWENNITACNLPLDFTNRLYKALEDGVQYPDAEHEFHQEPVDKFMSQGNYGSTINAHRDSTSNLLVVLQGYKAVTLFPKNNASEPMVYWMEAGDAVYIPAQVLHTTTDYADSTMASVFGFNATLPDPYQQLTLTYAECQGHVGGDAGCFKAPGQTINTTCELCMCRSKYLAPTGDDWRDIAFGGVRHVYEDCGSADVAGPQGCFVATTSADECSDRYNYYSGMLPPSATATATHTATATATATATPTATPTSTRSRTHTQTQTASAMRTHTSTPTPSPTTTGTPTALNLDLYLADAYGLPLHLNHTSIRQLGTSSRATVNADIVAAGSSSYVNTQTDEIVGVIANSNSVFEMNLPTGTVSTAATNIALGNFGTATSAVLVARVPISGSITFLNLSSPTSATTGDGVCLFTVDRILPNGSLVTEEAFTFTIYAPRVTDLTVYSYRSNSTEAVDITAEGGTVTSFGNGTFLVSATHTSTFASFVTLASPSPSANELNDALYGLFGLLALIPLVYGATYYYYSKEASDSTPTSEYVYEMPNVEYGPQVAPTPVAYAYDTYYNTYQG